MMSEPHSIPNLGDALAAALADAYHAYAGDNRIPVGERTEWGPNVQRIEMMVQIDPRGRSWAVVEVLDRRPGRSSLESYALSSQAGKTRLQRKKAAAFRRRRRQ